MTELPKDVEPLLRCVKNGCEGHIRLSGVEDPDVIPNVECDECGEVHGLMKTTDTESRYEAYYE